MIFCLSGLLLKCPCVSVALRFSSLVFQWLCVSVAICFSVRAFKRVHLGRSLLGFFPGAVSRHCFQTLVPGTVTRDVTRFVSRAAPRAVGSAVTSTVTQHGSTRPNGKTDVTHRFTTRMQYTINPFRLFNSTPIGSSCDCYCFSILGLSY